MAAEELEIIHQEPNALVFLYHGFGRERNPVSLVVCLRSNPANPASLAIEIARGGERLLADGRNGLLKVWGLDAKSSGIGFNPFGFDGEDDPFGHNDSEYTPSPVMPGHTCRPISMVDGTLWPGESDVVVLDRELARILGISFMAGSFDEMLGILRNHVMATFGLAPEEAPADPAGHPEYQEKLLEWPRQRRMSPGFLEGQLREARDLFAGCPDECQPDHLLWYGPVQPESRGRGEWRHQNARALPLLVGIVSSDPSLRLAVENGKPLLPDLQTLFPGFNKAALKRLSRIRQNNVSQKGIRGHDGDAIEDPDLLGNRYHRTFSLTGEWRMKDALKDLVAPGLADRVPDSDGEWNAFATLYGGFLKPLNTILGIDPGPAIMASRGKWQALQGQVERTLGLTEPLDRRQANVMTLDMLQLCDQFNRHILVPTLGTLMPSVFKTEREGRFEALKRREITSSFQLASTLLLSSSKEQPLLHYAELLRRGMPRLARFNSAIAGYEEEYSQPEKPGLWNDRNFTEPLTGPCEVEGVVFTPIHTRAGLRKEGERMKHCIGGPGYWREHRSGTRVSYHLDGPGKSQATLSLIFNREGKILKSGFNAIKNRTPAPSLDIARIRFQEGVNSGQIPIRQEYMKWQEWRLDLAGNELTSMLEDYCHYPVGSMNHTSTDDIQPEVILTTRLWQEWREVVGRTDLASPLEYLVGEDEARQFIARLAGWKGRQLIENLDYHFGEDSGVSSRLSM